MFDNPEQMKEFEKQGKRFVSYDEAGVSERSQFPSIDPQEYAQSEVHPGQELDQYTEEPQPNFPNGKPDTEDYQLWPEGPWASQVQAWKKMFGVVAMTEIAGEAFIWRRLTRYEYKAITAIPNTTPLQREEMICETCTLWPEGFSYEVQGKGPAGHPGTLAKEIMIGSGFTNTPQTTIL